MELSTQLQKCRVCAQSSAYLWPGNLLDLNISYYKCPSCHYVQTEQPYWLDRAYGRAINESDTGILARNYANSRIVLATLMSLGKTKGLVVDCAGGYGILVRLLRDMGVSALWSDRYCQNLVARGFEYAGGAADLVTSFEAFEHFVEPSAELDGLLAIAPSVLISTQIIPEPTPQQSEWWYYGRDHGQHIGFFSVKTLEYLAKEKGKTLLTDGRCYHLFTDPELASHYWKLFFRFSRFSPFLAKRRLQSKTWSDYLIASERNK